MQCVMKKPKVNKSGKNSKKHLHTIFKYRLMGDKQILTSSSGCKCVVQMVVVLSSEGKFASYCTHKRVTIIIYMYLSNSAV